MIKKKKWKNELKRTLLALGYTQRSATALSKQNHWAGVYPYLTPDETVDWLILFYARIEFAGEVLLESR